MHQELRLKFYYTAFFFWQPILTVNLCKKKKIKLKRKNTSAVFFLQTYVHRT